jgi:hypothetical protein
VLERRLMLKIPELVVGTAARHGAVTVLPLFPSVPGPGVAYRLGTHAIASGTLEIHELSGGAVVDRLEARNRGGERVLFVEGDHLLGSRQNRVVTSSALLGGRRTVTLPVSCVEQGRWQGEAHRFRGIGSVAPASVRSIIKQTVTSALFDRRSRAADQGRIWSQIADQQRRLRVTSATCALEASYATLAGDLRPIAARLPYAPSATGVAIGIAGQLVSIDLFDQPATCALYWPQLVEGAALEALELAAAGSVGNHEVEHLVAQLRDAAWRPVPAVGEGEELRARTAGASASALVVDGCIVHLGAAAGAGLESAPRPMRRELPPELAGRYRIVSRLGVGGVKEVFRAADLRGGRDVAIARIPYARREHIEREVETARRVQGPYVPQIFEAVIDAYDDGYLVMELCEGPSLAAVASRPLPPAEAGPILVELARALRAVHAACVLHRDVKPENVLLCPTAHGVQLKIVDFGLSAEAVDETSAIINLREFSGTLPYMAREALRGTDVDARADVFAFGVCCYRVLVGEVPLEPRRNESSFEYVHRLSSVARHDLSRLPPLPPPAGEVLARILEGDRERRPYMPEVVAAFERAFGTGPITIRERAARRPSSEPGTPMRSPRPAMTRVCRIPAPVYAPEHVLVAPCGRAPLIVLAPTPEATMVRALDAGGRVRWARRVDARLTAGLRADLDGDGVREVYLAGPDRVVALELDGEVRYTRAPRAAASTPTLAAIPDRVAPSLLVDGHALEPRTGLPRGMALRAYEGDGRRLVEAPDPRGASYHGGALQAFRGAHGTAAAIVIHARERGFHVAHLEEDAGGRTVQVVIYGPGGGRVRALRVQHCDVPTGDEAAIASLASRERRLFGPEHAPLAVLGPDGTAVVIAPLIAADPAVPSGIAAYALPDGRELWRVRLPARRGRAVLGDVDGDGRPELVVGTGDGVLAYDPWTGALRMELPDAGLPVAIGDPFATGFQHLVTVTGEGLELWRGQRCRPGAMQWAGPRGDLWRTGTVDAGGTPVGPL